MNNIRTLNHHSNRPKIGLACAGGGIEGAVYEIGALCAIDEALDGIDFSKDIDTYVGVSAGAIITACLANGVTPRQLSLAILSSEPDVHPITPEIFFTPAISEYVKRGLSIPSYIKDAIQDYFFNPDDISMIGSFARLINVLPVGIFDNEPISEYFEKNFTMPGRTNDFRELPSKLRIVAVELDSGKTVRFGDKKTSHVPISKAVQASSALPAVYVPVCIDGKYYVDGVARRTVHASVALQEGVKMLFCLNPIVPLNSLSNPEVQSRVGKSYVEFGLPTVLSQTFRTMIYSRMKAGLKGYVKAYPEVDIALFEPRADDDKMFFNNIFSFSSRRETCEHAYQTTRTYMRENFEYLQKKFERHHITINKTILEESRKLYGESQKTRDSLLDVTKPYKGTLSSLQKTLYDLEKILEHDALNQSA